MYIHASSGTWYDHSYSFMSSSREYVNDHYFIGKPSWLDRLAIARITITGDEAIRRQNKRFYPGFALLCLIVLAGLWTLATITNLVFLGVVAIAATLFCFGLNVYLLLEDSVDMHHPSVSHAPSVKLAEWWLTRGPHRHHLLLVSESRVLRMMATGRGAATGNVNSDNSVVYQWFQANAELKPEVDRLLLDEEINEFELLLRSRPATPNDEDREAVAELKNRLDAKVHALSTLVAEREAKRLAAEQTEAARLAAAAEQREREAAAEESARTDAWRQRTARALSTPQA